MAGINTLTVLYLTGLTSLGQALIYFGLIGRHVLRDQRAWLVHQVLIGLSFLVLAVGVMGDAPDFYVLTVLLFLSAYLARFIAVGTSLGERFTKRSLTLGIAIIIFVGILFTWCQLLGAPLGSLETIVLLPLGVAAGLTAKYSWDRRQAHSSAPMLLIGHLLWIESAIYGVLAIGALAGIGQDYVHPESFVSTAVALITFVIQLMLPILWVIYLALEKPEIFTGAFNFYLRGLGAKNVKTKVSASMANQSVQKSTMPRKKAVSTIDGNPMSTTQDSHLTTKELEILRLVVLGRKNKEIADDLQISEASVKVHKSRMTSKLGVKTLPELAVALQRLDGASMDHAEVASATSVVEPTQTENSTESNNQS